MAYGSVTGGSVSLYDLYAFAKEIFSGNVSVPMTDEQGAILATQDGEDIMAVKNLENKTGLSQSV